MDTILEYLIKIALISLAVLISSKVISNLRSHQKKHETGSDNSEPDKSVRHNIGQAINDSKLIRIVSISLLLSAIAKLIVGSLNLDSKTSDAINYIFLAIIIVSILSLIYVIILAIALPKKRA